MKRTHRPAFGKALATSLILVLAACGAKQTEATGSASQPATTSMQPVAATTLPCAVSEILAANCQMCHGAMPANGAPMSLVTLSDLQAPARSNASMTVFQMLLERVQDRARPMPPDPTKHLSDAALATLQSWVSAGAQGGPACSPAIAAAGSGAVQAYAGQAATSVGGGLTAPAVVGGRGAGPNVAGSSAVPASAGQSGGAGQGGAAGGDSDPLAADIENCYPLLAHGQPTPGDMTHYTVPTGETYTSFIFKSPWTKPVQGLRFRHLPDNVAVLHHWLLYSETAQVSDGAIDPCALAGPTGFLCGQATTRSLITGWAPGRGDFELPADVGLELPAPGAMMALEFHYYNTTSGMTASDQSGVEICVTSKFRANTASVTWLGSENIAIPAHATGTASGSCAPLRMGIQASDPIHIIYSWPHMHKLGTHMTSIVNRAAGGQDTLWDGDFSFNFQVLHDTPLMLMPGDTIATTCTYQNTTDDTVMFGQSTQQEMCFNFAYAWPAHALDNAGQVGGAENTCLH
jgi:hypothetical protein